MEVHLGSGVAKLERIDVTGNLIGPRDAQLVQSFALDIDWDMKELYGSYQQPQAIGRGKQKTTGKITFAGVDGRMIADTVFGLVPATGQLTLAVDEAQTVPSGAGFTVTVANAANFATDEGVKYAASGLLFVRVTSAPAQGQYAVNSASGVYTFNSADANAAIRISYTWNNAGSGLKTTMTNQLLGTTPQFRLVFTNTISPGAPGEGGQTLPFNLQLNACTINKFSLPYKQDDWLLQDLDFGAFADATGTLGYLSTGQ